MDDVLLLFVLMTERREKSNNKICKGMINKCSLVRVLDPPPT